jgi:hypothetical protein
MTIARFWTSIFIGLVVFASPAFSDPAKIIPRPDKADSVIIPAGSALRFRAFDQEGTAKFDGAIELSGTYYYGDNALDDGTTERTLNLFPDAATKARIPHFKDRGLPDAIWLEGADAFASAVISKDQLAALHRKGAKNVAGHIDIMVDKFEMGIECDAPTISAHFLSVVQRPMRVASKDQPDTGC